ncbi:hypothetical protein [Nocardioides campestrisoli]|uniref:hypothetical protein n=1 Tax=Nocardioides campestrisoli TaxID=2736757 RepID=UPI00163D4818|nr:hypothetical protein [Nocardioides campestrisoli]
MRAGDLAALVPTLIALEDADRKACVRPLRDLARSGEFGTPFELINPLAVAGVAILPDSRAVAAWLRRFPPMGSWQRGPRADDAETTTRAVIEVLTERDPSWLPTLLRLLVERLRPEGPGGGAPLYEIAEALREHGNLAPPASPAYVADWVLRDWPDWVAAGASGPPGHEREFRELFPLVLEEEGTAYLLTQRPWSTHFETALARDLVDRAGLLGAILARLQRGGRATDTQAVVALHDVLSPTLDEVAECRRDYLALLPPGSASSCAAIAQRELRRLYEGGLLTTSELVEQSRSVLLRTDKKLMRDHLALLKAHAFATPDDVDDIVTAASSAFANAAPDIQRAGVDLVAGHADQVSSGTLDAALAAAAMLPRDLEDRLRSRAGLGRAARRDPAPVAVLTPPKPVSVVPIEDLDQAVAVLLALMRCEENDMAPLDVERVVEALPRFGARDQDALYRAVASLVDRPWYEYRTVWGLHTMLELLAAACVGRAKDVQVDKRHAGYSPVLDRVIQFRIADLTAAVRDRPGVRSVALPSWDNGVLCGDVLLARLTEARREGWEPSALDLEQALLRLDLTGLAPEPFEALATPAGRQAATWITEGGPDEPSVRAVRALQWERPRQSYGWNDKPSPTPHLWVAEVVPGSAPRLGAPGALWSLLHSWSPHPQGVSVATGWSSAFGLWAWTAPHHRDVVAAHLLRPLARSFTDPSRAGDALVPLARADGAVGDGLLLALCSAMGAKQQQTRSATVDALLILATRDQLDGARLGELMGAMVIAGDLVTRRLAEPFTQAAAAGAAAHVWAAVAGLLSAVLTHEGTVAGLAPLLSAAVDIAEDHRCTGIVAGLDDMATRKGRSQQVVEARRLRDVLIRNAG